MAVNIPVLLSPIPPLAVPVPLLKVTTYAVTESYKSASIATGPFVQMVGLSTKTIKIDALLVGIERALRPALEALALNTIPGIITAVTFSESFFGIAVVSKNFIHLDMQITQLIFTQDNQNRETLTVHIELLNVPRPKKLGGFLPGADIALGAGSAFL
jgi:hypothetical protein